MFCVLLAAAAGREHVDRDRNQHGGGRMRGGRHGARHGGDDLRGRIDQFRRNNGRGGGFEIRYCAAWRVWDVGLDLLRVVCRSVGRESSQCVAGDHF